MKQLNLLIGAILFLFLIEAFAKVANNTYPSSPLTPGARIIAGDLSRNEFYILGKNESVPIKAPLLTLVPSKIKLLAAKTIKPIPFSKLVVANKSKNNLKLHAPIHITLKHKLNGINLEPKKQIALNQTIHKVWAMNHKKDKTKINKLAHLPSKKKSVAVARIETH